VALRLYDTLSRAVKEFEPLHPEDVRIYACGPTVYDHAHIGNYRSFLVYDLLHRYLVWSGYKVHFVMNLTDVDDRTIERAVEEGKSIADYTSPFSEQILADARTLGIITAQSYPLATEYVKQMISWIEKLEERGLAYAADDSSVYFSIDSFPTYGRLKGLDPDQARSGERVAEDNYAKEDVRDFALWKAAKPVDEKVGAAWDSPWGRGRPGWHLECSVMSITELGETLDIHMGGEDLIFPHHENEIAQSEGVTGKTFARHWLHVKHLIVEGEKMSKSIGNTITVRDLLSKGIDPAAIRHQLLSARYRHELNFTWDGLEASATAIQRLLDFDTLLNETKASDEANDGPLGDVAEEAVHTFRKCMDDDLNCPEALAALFVFVNRSNKELHASRVISAKDLKATRDALSSMDRVLGLLSVAREGREIGGDVEAWVNSLIEERETARENYDFQRADAIRQELAEKGIALEDSATGTRWKVVT